MKKLIFTLAAIISLSSVQGFAAFSGGDAGTSAAQFLKLGAGARGAGMGEAMGAAADDSTAIYWNPAGLNKVSARSLSVMHAVWFEDISYDWVSYAMRYKNWGVFGLGIQYLSYGSIKQIDNAGLETGDFNPSDLCVSLSYARKFKGVGLGLNAKYISQKIVNSAAAYAVDLGAQYKLMNVLDDKLTLGLAVQNMGTKIKLISEEDPLPMNVKIGAAYALRPNWKVAIDANAPIDNDIYIGAGTEYRCKVKEKIDVIGRVGYNTENTQTGGTNGVTAGIGFRYMDYCIDYAFVPYGDLGNVQRISLSILW